MSENKWKYVGISRTDFYEIQHKMVRLLGYSSVSSFVQEAVRDKLDSERWRAEKRIDLIRKAEKDEQEERL